MSAERAPGARREDAAWRLRLQAAPLTGPEARAFAEFALNRVSRTFALNIVVLPEPLRGQVRLAYLYCRMADTLEDDAGLATPEKILLLGAFADLFDPDPAAVSRVAFEAFPGLLPDAWHASDDWEKILLVRAPVVLNAFPELPEAARAAIAQCVREMCAGMADFTLRREERAAQNRALIETVAELDAYCYYVAGTVGVLLCELFVDHAKIPAARAQAMRGLCVSFGLGLQLTNILKDVRDDRERGVSWIPGEMLAEGGLTRAVQARLFAKARRHLEEALEYTVLIPRAQRRLRLFCLWPLFMAAETLALLAENDEALAGGARLKISRRSVGRILLRTRLIYPFNTWLRADLRSILRRVDRALPLPSLTDTFDA